MPRAFPFALGIGTDICKIDRIRRILMTKSARSFTEKLLNSREREAYASKFNVIEDWATFMASMASKDKSRANEKDVMDWRLLRLATFLSGRWAAKEAAYKAHTHRRLTWHAITILDVPPDKDGRPRAPIMTIKTKDDSEEEQVAKFSISHDGEYATAVCMVAEEVEDDISDASVFGSKRGATEGKFP